MRQADAEFRAIENNINALLARLDASLRQLTEFSALERTLKDTRGIERGGFRWSGKSALGHAAEFGDVVTSIGEEGDKFFVAGLG